MKTYTFHVSLPRTGRTWRKIETGADQTLEQLHLAIQDAFDFDNDHLYSFFLSGKAWDQTTEYTVPEHAHNFGPFAPDADDDLFDDDEDSINLAAGISPDQLIRALFGESAVDNEQIKQMMADRLQGLEPLYTDPKNALTAKIDDLGLTVGQKILYLFDYGDEWRFSLRVHTINSEAADGEYPRIVESVGKPPEQYPNYDEEETDE